MSVEVQMIPIERSVSLIDAATGTRGFTTDTPTRGATKTESAARSARDDV
jgi:hypothetical protein